MKKQFLVKIPLFNNNYITLEHDQEQILNLVINRFEEIKIQLKEDKKKNEEYFNENKNYYEILNKFKNKDKNKKHFETFALLSFMEIFDLLLFSFDIKIGDQLIYDYIKNNDNKKDFKLKSKNGALEEFDKQLYSKINKNGEKLSKALEKFLKKQKKNYKNYLKIIVNNFENFLNYEYYDFLNEKFENVINFLTNSFKNNKIKILKLMNNLFHKNIILPKLNNLLIKNKLFLNKGKLDNSNYLFLKKMLVKNFYYLKETQIKEDWENVIKNTEFLKLFFKQLKEVYDSYYEIDENIYESINKLRYNNTNLFDNFFKLNTLSIFQELIYYLNTDLKDLLIFDFINNFNWQDFIDLNEIKGSFLKFKDKLSKEINININLLENVINNLSKRENIDIENLNDILDDYFLIKYYDNRILALNSFIKFFKFYKK